jgi:hypothetical protein
MVASLAPVVAGIFMAHMETTLTDSLMDIRVCEWHRYFDDTFVLIEPSIDVSDVLHILNNFHSPLDLHRRSTQTSLVHFSMFKSLNRLNDKHSK